jgi:hypothetical protein
VTAQSADIVGIEPALERPLAPHALDSVTAANLTPAARQRDGGIGAAVAPNGTVSAEANRGTTGLAHIVLTRPPSIT